MLEPYDGKLSRTVLRREGGGNTADPADYYPLVEALGGQVIHISSTSRDYINPMDINLNYADDDNPLGMKSDFILSLCELIMGARDGMEPEEKSVIDRCLPLVYQKYLNDPKPENMLKSLGMMRIKGWLVSILTSQGIRKFINARKWCICSKIAKRVPSI